MSSKQSAKIFYEYFKKILLDVDIKAINLGASENHETSNIVLIALKYKDHLSIKSITNFMI